MCGIVGLLLKQPALRSQLGELMTPMLIGMTSRGPDSAGVAIFREPEKQARKFSLFWTQGTVDWRKFGRDFDSAFEGKHRLMATGRHGVLVARLPARQSQLQSARRPARNAMAYGPAYQAAPSAKAVRIPHPAAGQWHRPLRRA